MKTDSTPRRFNWSLPPENPELSSEEVHVWIADIERNPQLAQLAKTLSRDEEERAARFYFKQDRKRFIAARGVLRAILSSCTKIPAAQLEFSYEANGKPRLANLGETVEFNLSHSGGLAVYAITKNRRVGVDLELVNFLSDMDAIAERCFSREEQSTLQFLEPLQKEENFFRYWTRKEAKLKCSGEGFSSDFQHEKPFDGTLLELEPAQGFVAALAVDGKPFTLKTWQWPASCEFTGLSSIACR